MSSDGISGTPVSGSKEKGGEKEKPVGTVPFLSLYSECDSLDYIALSLGIVGAIANGWTFPLFSFVFGEVRRSERLRV